MEGNCAEVTTCTKQKQKQKQRQPQQQKKQKPAKQQQERAAAESKQEDDQHPIQLIDIGANLLDDMFHGMYRGKQGHPDDFEQMLGRAEKANV